VLDRGSESWIPQKLHPGLLNSDAQSEMAHEKNGYLGQIVVEPG